MTWPHTTKRSAVEGKLTFEVFYCLREPLQPPKP